jgi:hypothetical protein
MIERFFFLSRFQNLQSSLNTDLLIRWGIILGVFAVNILLVPRIPTRMIPYAVFFILGVFVVLLLLRWPPLGLLMLLFGSMIIPYGIGTGTATTINPTILVTGLIFGVWVVDGLARKRREWFRFSRPLLPLIIFVILAILSFGNGLLPWFVYAPHAPLRSQIGGLATFLLSAIAFFHVSTVIKNERWLQALTWLFLVLAGVNLLCRILPPLRGVSLFLPYGLYSGSLFWTWTFALAFSQALFNRKLHGYWRTLLIGLVLMVVFLTLVRSQGWKSGWFPLVPVVISIFWFRFPKMRLFLVISGILLSLLMLPKLIETDEYSYITRLEAWKLILVEIVKVNPVLGLGPANYYFYTPLFPILGYYVRFNSHNNYVDLVAQSGILGLIVFLWLMYEVARLANRLIRNASSDFQRAYLYGALGGLAGTLVAGMLGDWIIPFVYNISLNGMRASILAWMFLGGILVIDNLNSNKSPSK